MKKIISILFVIVILLSLATSCDDNTQEKNDNFNNPTYNKTENKETEEETEKLYTVYFETNGGSEIPPETTKLLKEAPIPNKVNLAFAGWYRNQELTNKVDFPLYINENITIYAKWIPRISKTSLGKREIKNTIGKDKKAGIYLDNNLNIKELKELGYNKIKITCTYSVKYTKDYWLNIGYEGSPKYTLTLTGMTNKSGTYTNYVSKQYQETSFEFVMDINEYEKNIPSIIFETNTTQNTIYFKDITYECDIYK